MLKFLASSTQSAPSSSRRSYTARVLPALRVENSAPTDVVSSCRVTSEVGPTAQGDRGVNIEGRLLADLAMSCPVLQG